jgi:hypothetical protein
MILVPVSSFAHRVLSLLSASALATAVAAQCTNPTLRMAPNIGPDGGLVASTWWDPDGPGPANPLVVFGGSFRIAGMVASPKVVTFDPVAGSWGALPGIDAASSPYVLALCVLPNGDLVAGGRIGTVGGAPARNLVRWTGTTWATLGGGTDGDIVDMAVDGAGRLVVAGSFTEAGGVPAARVARFDGTTWTALGNGLTGVAQTLSIAANGDVIVGGDSLLAVSNADVARWDGATWSAVGGSIAGYVLDLLEDPAGLLVAGQFQSAGGVAGTRNLARWNGTAWTSLGMPAGLASEFLLVRSLLRTANGDLVVGGAANGAVAKLARLGGLGWVDLSVPTSPDRTSGVNTILEQANGDLLVGGALAGSSDLPVESVLRVSPSLGFQPVQNGLPLRATAIVEHASGDLYVGGAERRGYTTVWRRQGSAWGPIDNASGGGGPTTTILGLVALPNGHVVASAAGSFLTSSVPVAPSVSRWDGVAWTSLGALDDDALALLVEPNGSLVAGGRFTTIGGVAANGLARWNGAAWSAIPAPPGPVQALLRLPSGELVVATANRVYRQTVAGWLPLGWNILDVRSLALLADGTLVAGGGFVDAGGTLARFVARWTGTVWLPLGNGLSGTVTSLLPLPNGDLLAGGFFISTLAAPALGLARWNGSSWTQFGPGTREVADLAFTRNGDVLVAGSFVSAGTQPTKSVARITTSCPALAVSSGAGCVGSGGANVLATTSLPWLGSTFRSVASGLAPSSIAVHVLGAGPASVPLPSLLPPASAGCVLQVTPDALAALPTNAGSAIVALPIPNVAGLLGLVLHQQVVALELDPFANVVGASAGNVLVLTLGAF